ncbi:MAG: glycolate oxidase subunit GlcF [Thiotrichales bacterium]
MQTQLDKKFLETSTGKVADSILRACVHCGFCNATCPTYQLLGDELDGPRGRIYQIKQVLEGTAPATGKTLLHLDRCLTCRSCESTCPSGVAYGKLLDIGRHRVEKKVQRPLVERIKRGLLRGVLLSPKLFSASLALGRLLRPLLPTQIAEKIPEKKQKATYQKRPRSRRMLMLEGCVQPALSPEINQAAKRVLDQLDIEIIAAAGAGCCGAINQHLSAEQAALIDMKKNIDAWWPAIEQGAEALVMTASACGAMIKEYGYYLRDDPDYAVKAARVSELARDLVEVLAGEDLQRFRSTKRQKIAFHPPCTLQHGQQIKGDVEKILRDLGYELNEIKDSHLCCGSAGTYSLLQPELSQRLKKNKIANLLAGEPELIVSANLGCQLHLSADAGVPVTHWITLLEQRIGG